MIAALRRLFRWLWEWHDVSYNSRTGPVQYEELFDRPLVVRRWTHLAFLGLMYACGIAFVLVVLLLVVGGVLHAFGVCPPIPACGSPR